MVVIKTNLVHRSDANVCLDDAYPT